MDTFPSPASGAELLYESSFVQTTRHEGRYSIIAHVDGEMRMFSFAADADFWPDDDMVFMSLLGVLGYEIGNALLATKARQSGLSAEDVRECITPLPIES